MRLVAAVELVASSGDHHAEFVVLGELKRRLNVPDRQREDDEVRVLVEPHVAGSGLAEVRLPTTYKFSDGIFVWSTIYS